MIVGGGVIGLSCAYFLQRAGAAVTVVERGTVGNGCSHGNCGFICPSHVLPLAGPGMIGQALWALFQRESPFKIRWRFDPALWGWLFRFARRCNRRDMLEAGRAIQALLNSSRALYSELFRTEPLEAEWQERGTVVVFRTKKAFEHSFATDRLLREQFAVEARPYQSEQLVELEPALQTGLAGGWHFPGDAHLRPDKLLASWHALLQSRGVQFRENCTLEGFEIVGRLVRAVQTSQGTIPAEAVVIATGAWTPLLHRVLGCRVPIQPGKGYSLTMARPRLCPKYPLIFEEHRVAITPLPSCYRIGSTMELAGYDATLNRRRLELLRKGASHYLIEPIGEPVLEEWWGWRPMVHDGKPIIGRTPSHDNVVLATGHGMLGMAMSPGTGKLVMELLTAAPPHVDPAPYAPTRF